MCGDVSGLDLLGKIDFLCLREGEGRKERKGLSPMWQGWKRKDWRYEPVEAVLVPDLAEAQTRCEYSVFLRMPSRAGAGARWLRTSR